MISATSERLLETQIFDNEDSFSIAKIIPADFYRIIEYKKPQGTNYGGLQGFFNGYCARYRIISLGPVMSMKTISQEKIIFPRKNSLGHFFLVLPSMADLR